VCGVGGSCAVASPTSPGCADAECCASICTADPFCCEILWDSLCAGAAQSTCFAPGDFNYDGTVNAADLATLLGGWGGGGATDLNGDGVTNAADLAVLLANWG
ncbi:MAG: dockerin type I repeat-containing protein, partial [Planctomycetota bacterium]